VSKTSFDELAARALARRSRQLTPPARPDDELERAAAVRAMAAAARARVWRRRAGVGALGAAAAIAVGIGLAALARGGWPGQPGPSGGAVAQAPTPLGTAARARQAGEDTEVRLPGGAEVKSGQTLFAQGRDGVVLSSATGTRLRLEGDGELGVVEVGRAQRFKLARGWLHVEVAPLVAGERFLIDTGDAEVEVHGTAFDVVVVPADPRCRAGTVTRVNVAHGLVEIRAGGRDEQVGAGQHWPPECAAPAAAAAPAPSPAEPAERPAEARRATAARPEHRSVARDPKRDVEPEAPAAAPASAPESAPAAAARRRTALADQNDLLAAALEKKAQGQGSEALADLDELLDRWPESPLAESAMAERMRILKTAVEPRAARRAARDYLARFPSGFARAEAQLLVDGGP
jgi:hypothetical protein